ncbi:MAG: DUF6273 domain-containing protein [Lentimicrobiaceae bacterium]|nr:DUF6273 domain-containing protein [Lentimicrobiaceae bacterium]
MLLSQYILDAMPLDEDRRNLKIWHDCNLRKWLNHTFLQTVFDEKERAMIVKNVCKDNGEKIMYDKYSTAEKDTKDFVFLLSDAERNMIEENLGRRTHVAGTATDFAKQRGIFVCKDNGFSSWWLRTRSDDRYRGSFQTMFVECREGYVTYPYDDDKYFEDHAGELDHRGDTPYGIKRGVRPAIVITGQDF